MKWLKSTTDKTYTAQGKIIPASNAAPLAVSDTVFESITAMPVIKSLIKTGGIIVLDKYEHKKGSPSEHALATLQSENARLQKENEEKSLKAAQFDELKAEAEKALADKDAEIERLKADLAKAKKSAKKDSE